MITAGTPVSHIAEYDDGFEFEYDGYFYSCEEVLPSCVKLEDSRKEPKSAEVEEAALGAYKPSPNMAPLSRKHLLL